MKQRIELEAACELVAERLKSFPNETVDLSNSSGRVLAEDIRAPIDQPPFDRSPLDGFAARADDTTGASDEAPVSLKIVSKLYAGDSPVKKIEPGEAARIMTGAPIPEGADSVIRQERTEWDGDEVQIKASLKPGQNYAPAGEDIKQGELLCEQGTLLRSPQLGVLASMGLKEVTVLPEPEVSVLTTGSELQEVGEELKPGKIYNSNNYMISTRLKECGAKVINSQVAVDEKDILREKLAELIPESDFLVTTGGVSVGEKDLILEVLEEMGAEIFFWKLAIKPGTPVVCGQIDDTIIFGLSGNPAACITTFDLLVRPTLIKINGLKKENLRKEKAIFIDDFNKSSSTRRMLRAWVVRTEKGNIVKLSKGNQRPGVLKTTLDCNCFIDVPAGSPPVKSGQEVEIFRLPEIYN